MRLCRDLRLLRGLEALGRVHRCRLIGVLAASERVVDALRPYGVTHVDMPCTPERVWQAIRAAG